MTEFWAVMLISGLLIGCFKAVKDYEPSQIIDDGTCDDEHVFEDYASYLIVKEMIE